MLNTGDSLPELSLQDQAGAARDLADLTGRKGLVLFVYSRDNTSGCTAEADEFNQLMAGFQSMGYGVAGLSRDSQASHAKFAAKLGLAYPILADPDERVIRALGAWGPKKSRGKVSEGPVRSTFVAGQDGVLTRVYPQVKAKGHAADVLAELGEA